jgi:hypothetical protein
MWKHMVCPYILKFNGLFYRNGVPAIVTPWMPHGNITEYLANHPNVDRLRLVSLDLFPPAPSISSPHPSSLCSFWCG